MVFRFINQLSTVFDFSSEVCNPHNLGVGSAVQSFNEHGVIKWIGKLTGIKETYAGLEMVSMKYTSKYVAMIK